MDEDEDVDTTHFTLLKSDESVDVIEEDVTFEESVPNAESTVISNEETTITEEQNESTEADRNHLTKKRRKIQIVKT